MPLLCSGVNAKCTGTREDSSAYRGIRLGRNARTSAVHKPLKHSKLAVPSAKDTQSFLLSNGGIPVVAGEDLLQMRELAQLVVLRIQERHKPSQYYRLFPNRPDKTKICLGTNLKPEISTKFRVNFGFRTRSLAEV